MNVIFWCTVRLDWVSLVNSSAVCGSSDHRLCRQCHEVEILDVVIL